MGNSDSIKPTVPMVQFNFTLEYKGERKAAEVRKAIEKAEAQIIELIQKDLNSDTFLPHFRWHVGVGSDDERWIFKIVATILDYYNGLASGRTQPSPGPVPPPPPALPKFPPLANFEHINADKLRPYQSFM